MQLKKQGSATLWCFISSLFLVSGTFAAPDEAALGKANGYSLCAPQQARQTRCLISTVSRMDEIYPARKVPKGVEVWQLKRTDAEQPLRYGYGFGFNIS